MVFDEVRKRVEHVSHCSPSFAGDATASVQAAGGMAAHPLRVWKRRNERLGREQE
jgi:hypothetical protein